MMDTKPIKFEVEVQPLIASGLGLGADSPMYERFIARWLERIEPLVAGGLPGVDFESADIELSSSGTYTARLYGASTASLSDAISAQIILVENSYDDEDETECKSGKLAVITAKYEAERVIADHLKTDLSRSGIPAVVTGVCELDLDYTF